MAAPNQGALLHSGRPMLVWFHFQGSQSLGLRECQWGAQFKQFTVNKGHRLARLSRGRPLGQAALLTCLELGRCRAESPRHMCGQTQDIRSYSWEGVRRIARPSCERNGVFLFVVFCWGKLNQAYHLD